MIALGDAGDYGEDDIDEGSDGMLGVGVVEYEDDEHGIWRHRSRIDMLTRIGRFLDEHLDRRAIEPGDAVVSSR